MRNFSLLLITVCAVSVKVHAVDEIIITAAPYTPPTSYTQHTVSLGAANTGDRDAQIFNARVKACTDYAANQKRLCEEKKEIIYKNDIEACEKMGTNGTLGLIGGSALATMGTAVAMASGPIGWAVLLLGSGVVVGGGGMLVQQEANSSCPREADRNREANTLACNNYKAKIEADICSKITPNMQ